MSQGADEFIRVLEQAGVLVQDRDRRRLHHFFGPTKPKTVKVRIAVALDDDGDWFAWGGPDDDSEAEVRAQMPDGSKVYWVTAKIQMPGADIEGEVEA